MDKLRMHTTDGVESNVAKIAALFPNCVTEAKDEQGNLQYVVDYDKLKVELGEVIEGPEERYQFTWPGKREAIRLANSPIAAALRPVREDSVDFDNTQNLYIEGDNLDVLKLMRETYLGKVKMIYIDPPYNTGNDFVYEDDFSQEAGDYLANSGQYDDQGNRLVANTESNGRFHTDWLNMIYPRLKVARDFLSEDGVIFISMDDNEIENLKKVCNEIFGEQNFIAQVVWERSYAPINLKKHFSESHDYVLCYAKSIEFAICNGLPRPDSTNAKYGNPDNDPRGLWRTDNLSVGPAIEEKIYPITTPSGRVCYPPKGRCWLYTKERFQEMVEDNRIWFGENGDNVPAPKRFLSEVKQGLTPMTIWKYTEVGHNQDAMRNLRELFDGEKVFDYSKPVELIKRMCQLYTDQSCCVLDFFSGSATTAHAVMQLNTEDGGNRKFIMVQLPEITEENSEARKAGYKNICEIGKERIRRAGKSVLAVLEQRREVLKHTLDRFYSAKPSATTQLLLMEDIKDAAKEFYKNEIEPKEKELISIEKQINHLDIGFRVLRLDSSNMEDVYYTPEKFDPTNLFNQLDNVKPDRTDEDLLFQVMLELDIPLSASIKCEQIAGKHVFNVAEGHLIATFDREVNETTVTEIAKQHPNYFVMRDASAANDNVLDNFEQIFRHYSPDTICKIL